MGYERCYGIGESMILTHPNPATSINHPYNHQPSPPHSPQPRSHPVTYPSTIPPSHIFSDTAVQQYLVQQYGSTAAQQHSSTYPTNQPTYLHTGIYTQEMYVHLLTHPPTADIYSSIQQYTGSGPLLC